MTKHSAKDLWAQILEVLDEKLQYGLLEQARAVSNVRLEGSELILQVADPEAAEFFNAHINQQRLVIMTRPIYPIDKVSVESPAVEAGDINPESDFEK